MTIKLQKAWTSNYFIGGYKHFVAINYWKREGSYSVLLVSVLDGKCNFSIPLKELDDRTKWTKGWTKLSKEDSIQRKNELKTSSRTSIIKACLHPSQDSDLFIPPFEGHSRDWNYTP